MRCFAAIDISDELRQKIDDLHITLKVYGEVENTELIEKKISEICKKAKPFEINIRSIGCFLDNNHIKVVWLGIESDELINLQKMFGSEKPHLTIARVKTKNDELKTFMEKNKNIEIGSMPVREIKLKKSILTAKGPVYEDIKVFELG